MTENELLEMEQRYSESKIQQTCVNWFRQIFPDIGSLLFAIPNGGFRMGRQAYAMKKEGVLKGVSDLILLYPSAGKSSLCIEMKRPKAKGRAAGRQEPPQMKWQALVEANGSSYILCHGLVEFIKAVCFYLQIDEEDYIKNALNRYPIYL